MIQCDNPACAHDGAITIETRVGGHPAFVCLVCHRYYVPEFVLRHVPGVAYLSVTDEAVVLMRF